MHRSEQFWFDLTQVEYNFIADAFSRYENATRLNDNDHELLKILAQILQSSEHPEVKLSISDLI